MNSGCEEKRNKKNKEEEEEDETESSKTFQTLPPEIILNVLSRLPISSLVQFKYTCRAWHMLAQDPNLLHDLWNSHKESQSNNNLCLIFHCDYPFRNHLYFLDFPSECHSSNYKQTLKRIQTPFSASMPEYDLVGSCNGFLCLSESLYNNSIYIYNPFKRDYIELPKSVQHPNQEVVYGFGFHSETRQYKVVKIMCYRKGNRGQYYQHRYTVPPSDVQIFTLGDSNWRSLGKVYYHLVQWPEQVIVNGRLHWVTKVGRDLLDCAIISLDLADEQFRVVPKPDHDDDEFDDDDDDVLKRSCSHLMVLRGCLGAVFECSNGTLEIWVMKEYDVKESWVMEFNIPIQMLQEPELEVNPCFKISKLAGRKSSFRVLCLLNKSEILLEYKSRVLIVYDPDSEKFKNVVFEGMPKWFQTAVHVGNLNTIATLITM